MSDALTRAGAGLVGACFSTTCIYPIEVVRTRIQAGKGNYGLWEGMITIARQEGWRTLYAGLSSQYFQTALANFIFFYFYPVFRKLMEDFTAPTPRRNDSDGEKKKPKLNSFQTLLVGIAAAIVQICIMTPINVALTRIKTNSPPADKVGSLTGVMLEILKSEGIKNLYAGFGPALILTLNPGLEFMVLEWLTQQYNKNFNKDGKPPNSAVNFVKAALSKCVATLLTYPYILIKVRMQNSGSSGIAKVFFEILQTQGFFGLFAGIQIQLFKSVLFSSIRSVALEKILQFVAIARKSLK